MLIISIEIPHQDNPIRDLLNVTPKINISIINPIGINDNY